MTLTTSYYIVFTTPRSSKAVKFEDFYLHVYNTSTNQYKQS